MELPSNHRILSSRFWLPSNGCLPRDRGGTGWESGTSWFSVGVGLRPWNLLLTEIPSPLPSCFVAVHIFQQTCPTWCLIVPP